jgi:PQQ-dependent dehydrogenase (s-GDH family)
MRKVWLGLIAITTILITSFIPSVLPDKQFDVKIISSGLSDPWSVVAGPSNLLWITESKGYRVLQINPGTGSKIVVLDLNSNREFPSFDELRKSNQPTPQGGVMGLALHPEFTTGKPYVYLSYVYKKLQGNRFLLRLARYRFDSDSHKLISPQIICDTVPASNDHNGGRMLISQIAGKPYLFYGVGDMGSGQFSNGNAANHAQDKRYYEGKILRFALEPQQGGSWIPEDNPAGTSSAIWSTGHRNPQGLAATLLNGKEMLYSSEHGPYSDDELNLIQKGGNYGHPLIIGKPDGNYDGLAASVSTEISYPGKWHTSYPLIQNEKHNADSIGEAYHQPLISFFSTPKNEMMQLFDSISKGNKADWKAYAPSGIAVYRKGPIPGWAQSLLVTSLKTGKLLRLKINNDGSLNSKIYEYVPSRARYRDVAVSSDGSKIYLVSDSSAITSGPTAENPKATSYRGCLLELTFRPS